MSDARRADRYPWLLAAALIAVVAFLLLAPISIGRGEFANSLEDALHVPLFAVVAVVLLAIYKRVQPESPVPRSYAIAFIGTVALGALGELAQGLGDVRHAQAADLLNDALGGALGLCWHARRHLKPDVSSARRTLISGAMLAICVLTALPLAYNALHYWKRWQQLPQLVTWNSTAGHHFVRPGTTPASIALVPSQWGREGELALHVGSGDGRWVGIAIEEPWPDWRTYATLELDLVNPTVEPLLLNVRIEDRQHNDEYEDRFNRLLTIPPLTRTTVRVPVAEIEAAPTGRRMAMDEIAHIGLFQDGRRGSRAYYLCAARLVRP